MKSVKCAVGATVLTPVVISAFLGLMAGLRWLMIRYDWIVWVLVAFVVLWLIIMVIGVWVSLYEHCVERGNNV